MSTKASHTVDDDEAAFRASAALIAQLLREKDENPAPAPKTQDEKQEAMFELYRELCFDEPMLPAGFEATGRHLGDELLRAAEPTQNQSQTKLAISNRLVDGVVQCCRKYNQPNDDATSSDANNDSDGGNTNANGSNSGSNANHAKSPAMARLAYSALIQVPSLCCQAKDLKSIQRLLGTYKGVDNIEESQLGRLGLEIDDTAQEQRIDQAIRQLTMDPTDPVGASTQSDEGDPTATDDPTDAAPLANQYEEVWAAESDPSDYDYGDEDNAGHDADGNGSSAYQAQQQARNIDHLSFAAFAIDPKSLSRADLSRTYAQARTAIISLLRQANYTLLSPLFQARDETIVPQLTQLILMLLTSSTPLIDDTMKSQGMYPLWVLRDAATALQSFVPSYLEVLQTLLGVDEAQGHNQQQKQQQMQIQQQSPNKNEIAPASIVGMASLSAWCSEEFADTQVRTKNFVATHSCIVQSMNEIAGILDKAGADTTNATQRNHLRGNLTPILELLANTSWSGKPRASQIALNLATISRKQAPQAMLNSGMFRQVLELAKTTDETPQHLMINFQLALLMVCADAPTVLGRYGWRYPGLAPKMVRDVSSALFLAILWNCFAIEMVPSSPTTQIKWKTSSNGASPSLAPVTTGECQDRCATCWEKFCAKIAEHLKSLVPGNPDAKKSDAAIKPSDELTSIIQDFARLANCLEHNALLRKHFIAHAKPECMDPIVEMLTQVSGKHTALSNKVKVEDSPANDEHQDEKSDPTLEITSSVRKVTKQITLLFQTIGSASSKTD